MGSRRGGFDCEARSKREWRLLLGLAVLSTVQEYSTRPCFVYGMSWHDPLSTLAFTMASLTTDEVKAINETGNNHDRSTERVVDCPRARGQEGIPRGSPRQLWQLYYSDWVRLI